MRGLLHTLYEYLALWFGLGILGILSLLWTVIAAPLQYLLPQGIQVSLGRAVIMHAFRFYLRALSAIGACRFDLAALDALREGEAVIIAPNHPCLLDAFFVLSRLPNVTCIMKASIVDNLFLGAGARLAHYIRNDSPLNMVLHAVEELASGNHLLVFPEATRTTRWPINGVSPGIARIAARAQVPVQTVLIETASPYLTKGWPLFRRPAMPIHYRVRLGKRFDPPTNPDAFTNELEQYLVETLRDAPCFLPRGCIPLPTDATPPTV